MKGRDMFKNIYIKKSTHPLLMLSALILCLTTYVGCLEKTETPLGKAGCQWKKRRILYNSDGHNAFLHCYPPESPDFVRRHVDEVLNTQVDTFLVCPNVGMRFSYPSQVGQMIGQGATPEEYTAIQAIAYDPNSKWSIERSIVNLRLLVEAGYDPIGLMVDRAREKKIEAFITFRMNDSHGIWNPELYELYALSFITDFWLDHPEWRTSFPTGAMNFAIPEVRERRLAELTECCERFDIDGLELDFLRHPDFFPPGEGPENIEVMTAFVRSVREMTERVGNERGRPLLLTARVHDTLSKCKAVGLDPVTWAKEGLIDFLTPSQELFTQEESPIAEFKDVIKNIPIYGDIQVVWNIDGNVVPLPPHDYQRVAKKHFQAGADGIYLFNFFTERQDGREPPWQVLYQIGSLETIEADDRVRANRLQK